MEQPSTPVLAWTDIIGMLNGIPHGIALLDDRFRIVGMNQVLEALTGYAAEHVLGIEEDFVIRGNFKGKVLKKVLESGDMVVVEGDIINASRNKLHVRLTASRVVIDSNGQPGIMMVLEDISFQHDADQRGHGKEATKGILGISPRMEEIFELLPVLAHTDTTVLITGETGTGKDLLAEAIHKASKRAGYPFIKVNCGALPETLLESELFGHVRGAFTGAHSDKPGLFRLAQSGTIFLTEIGDLPLSLQVKLLTVLDDREFFPLGGSKKVKVDVRLITATHRDLKQLVREGRFREDLFFRLNVLRVHIPSLRERQGDTRLLMDHFLQMFAWNLGKKIKGFSKEAVRFLTCYDYPGNVRELRNIVEYAVNVCRAEKIAPEHLPSYTYSETVADGAGMAASMNEGDGDAAGSGLPDRTIEGLPAVFSWTEIEKKQILDALVKTGGNRTMAARRLGLGRSTLWRKIKQYNLK